MNWVVALLWMTATCVIGTLNDEDTPRNRCMDRPLGMGDSGLPIDQSKRKLFGSSCVTNRRKRSRFVVVYSEYAPRCEGEVPPHIRGAVINDRPDEYKSAQTLCTARRYGGHPMGNLGGRCVFEILDGYPATNEFDFDALTPQDTRARDEFLYDAFLDLHYTTWCELHCFCDGRDQVNKVPKRKYPHKNPSRGGLSQDPKNSMFDSAEGAFPDKGAGAARGSSSTGAIDGYNSCGSSPRTCKEFSCAHTGIPGCDCLASKVNPRTREFSMIGCGLGFLSGLSGRNEYSGSLALGCPCNGTYVSAACCQSESKMVWESPEMKLGELDPGLQLLDNG